MSKALIIGAAFIDVVINVPELPIEGGDVTGSLTSSNLGGCAFNVYGALKVCNQPADLFVPVGIGQYADKVKEVLNQKNIPLLLQVDDADNGWDIALVKPDGERSFLTVNGIEQCWNSSWFQNIDINNYNYIYVSGYELENPISANVILNSLEQRKKDTFLVFDPSPRIGYFNSNILNRILTKNVIIHCNLDEIGLVMPQGKTLDEKLKRIFDLTHSPVIVTLGAKGACYYDGKKTITTPSENTTIINTIGAGDTHCGAMIAGLMDNLDLKTIINKANHLSSLVVGQKNGSLY